MSYNNSLQSAITRLKQQIGIFSHAVNDDILSDDVSAFTDITEEQAQEITRCCDILVDITDTLNSLCSGNVNKPIRIYKQDGTEIKIGDVGYMPYAKDNTRYRRVTVERIINNTQVEFADNNGRFVANKDLFKMLS